MPIFPVHQSERKLFHLNNFPDLINPATPIKAASARPSHFFNLNASACVGQRAMARLRLTSLLLPAGIPINFFQMPGVINETGM